MTKEEIGQEIAKWYLHDGPYCYTLVAMAHEEGLLSDDEATAAKEDLDKVYEHDKMVKETRGKYMTVTLKKLGFTKNKILWNMIAQFPSRCVGDPADCRMKPDVKKLVELCNLGKEVDFYTQLADIIAAGYVSQDEDNKLYYKINFDKIKEESEQL